MARPNTLEPELMNVLTSVGANGITAVQLERTLPSLVSGTFGSGGLQAALLRMFDTGRAVRVFEYPMDAAGRVVGPRRYRWFLAGVVDGATVPHLEVRT